MSDSEVSSEPNRSVREGLPSSYRMRADEHYVDFLAARTAADDGGAGVAAVEDEPESPDGQPVATVDVTADVGATLAGSLATASSLAELLTGSLSDLSRSALGTLLRAELFRASTLVDAARVVRGERPSVRSAVPVAGLIERVLRGFLSERRLRHVDVHTHIDLPPGHMVVADEAALEAAMASALVATLALLEGLASARLVFVAGLTASRQLTLLVSQDHVLPASTWADLAFDAGWTARPGGTNVALAMATIRQVARAHGGDPTASLTPRGTRLGLTIPAGA
ncbi:MAG: hypothetical protein U0Q55_13590 [Vicinamibacterales bacterium]